MWLIHLIDEDVCVQTLALFLFLNIISSYICTLLCLRGFGGHVNLSDALTFFFKFSEILQLGLPEKITKIFGLDH